MRTFLTIAVIFGAAALAQQANNTAPTKEALYISEAKLESIMQGAPPDAKTGKPGSFSARRFAANTFSTAFIRLDEPDQRHAHGTWSEVFVIKEGSGILETGGSITGVTGGSSAVHGAIFVSADNPGVKTQAQPPAQPKAQPAQPPAARRVAPGDLAGTGIEGGTKQRISAGDVILVPAGVAHTFIQIDQPVVYLKFPPADAPKAQ
jgi:mannose-6-phosphate isomerase-like protein (cupin superfamily)